MSKKIAVIIVCYNGREYLPDLLNSLKNQTLKPTEIIFVDNNSKDDSIDYVRKNFSEVILIENKKNLGFAQANNQGIKEAFTRQNFSSENLSGLDFIFLLNQDTICDNNCLEELVKSAENENAKTFAFQPLVLCWPEKDKIQTSGDKFHFLGFGYSGGYKLSIANGQSQSRDITYASGAAMFINTQALKEVGLLDEDLFMYHEDLDLCLRARFLGYNIFLAPQSLVYHKYKAGVSPHRWYWSERNRGLTLLKFYKLPTLILIFLPWLFMELGVLGYSLMTGWFSLKIKTYFSALRLVPKTLIKRAKVQRTRKISDRQFSKYLEAKFNFAGFEHPLLKYLVNPIFGLYWKIFKKIIFW
ncbi:MAG: glycosyltransferase family 2 protein [Patescibacteria group bacterium]